MLRPGWSLDLAMNDLRTGKPWDLSRPEVQNQARQLVRSTQPYFIIGSPPCTPFSSLQEISRAKWDLRVMEEQLRRGTAHTYFCLHIYRMQLAGNRHFVYEHPDGSTAWSTPDMVEFMMRPELDAAVFHMCTYGMTSTDEIGAGLVKKPTMRMSSSPEVLKRAPAAGQSQGSANLSQRTWGEDMRGNRSAQKT